MIILYFNALHALHGDRKNLEANRMLLMNFDYTGNLKDTIVIPDEYRLHQPYPNPFNPTTNIKYFLYNDSYVNISVFDLGGHLIDELISDYQKQGYHDIYWMGNNNSSGIYFLRITNGERIITKKLLLLK